MTIVLGVGRTRQASYPDSAAQTARSDRSLTASGQYPLPPRHQPWPTQPSSRIALTHREERNHMQCVMPPISATRRAARCLRTTKARGTDQPARAAQLSDPGSSAGNSMVPYAAAWLLAASAVMRRVPRHQPQRWQSERYGLSHRARGDNTPIEGPSACGRVSILRSAGSGAAASWRHWSAVPCPRSVGSQRCHGHPCPYRVVRLGVCVPELSHHPRKESLT
jgi:hypothetical protein